MGIEVLSELTDEEIAQLHRLYQSEWWTENRQLDDVRRMVRNTDVIVALQATETDELIGFARVLTDYVYKALIFDVIVAEPNRNDGLGSKLMELVLSHPELRRIDRFELYCREEMVSFYEQWGFSEETGGSRLMRRYPPTEEK